MSESNNDNLTKTDDKSDTTEKKPACKACCACPETKQARDKWYLILKKLLN